MPKGLNRIDFVMQRPGLDADLIFGRALREAGGACVAGGSPL